MNPFNDNWVPLIVIKTIKKVKCGDFLYYDYRGSHDTSGYTFIPHFETADWEKLDRKMQDEVLPHFKPPEVMEAEFTEEVRQKRLLKNV